MRIGHAHDHDRVLEHAESRTQGTKGEVAVNVYIKLGSRSTPVFIAVAVTMLFLCLQSCSAAPSSPPIPGEPPIGWQQEITEGFDPPIERILIMKPNIPAEKLNQHAGQWGKSAFDVLEKLWNTKKRQGYHAQIIRFMDAVDAKRMQPFLEEQFEAYAQKKKLPDPERYLFYSVIGAMHRTSPDVLFALTRKYVLDAAPDVQHVLIQIALQRMPSKETLDLLHEISDAGVAPNLQQSIEQLIKRVAGIVRAQEPMDTAVAVEGSNKP